MQNKLTIENLFLFLLALLPLSIIVGSTVSSSFIVLIALLYLYFAAKNNHWDWIKDSHIKLLFIFYIYLIINSILSVEPALGITRNLGFIRFIILVAAIKYFLSKQKNSDFVFIIWTVIMSVTCLDVFFEFINGRNILGYGELYGGRIVSFFKDEPVVGGYLTPFFFLISGFLFCKMRKKNSPSKFLLLIIPVMIFFSIFLTGERSNSFKALLGMLIFLSFLNFGNLKKKIVGFILIISMAIITIVNSDYLKHRFYYQFVGEGAREPLQHLIGVYTVHYKNGIKVFKDYPVFGVGNKNFGHVCFKDYPPEQTGIGCTTHPHQIYFELLSEHGIVGTGIILSIFIYFFIINLKIYFKNRNEVHLGTIIYFLLTFLPLIPTGTFFGSFNSNLFWLNFAFMLTFANRKNAG